MKTVGAAAADMASPNCPGHRLASVHANANLRLSRPDISEEPASPDIRNIPYAPQQGASSRRVAGGRPSRRRHRNAAPPFVLDMIAGSGPESIRASTTASSEALRVGKGMGSTRKPRELP